MKPASIMMCLGGIIFLTVGCKHLTGSGNDSGEVSGGPCSYDEYRVPARIIEFEVLDSASVDVTFKLDSNEWFPPPYDTISFYMEKGRFMTRTEADSLNLKKGKALTYLIQRIKTGACNPEINTLLMETMK